MLKRNRLRPAWQFRVDGVLWQVHTGSGKCLVGEERDLEKKQATFFCLDRKTGSAFWKKVNPGDPWWIGIEAVTDRCVVFHGFASPDLPGHRSIIAVDITTGRTLWSRPDLRFLATRGTTVVGAAELRSGIPEVQLDAVTGQEVTVAAPRVSWEGIGDGEPALEIRTPGRAQESNGSSDLAALRENCPLDRIAGPLMVLSEKDRLIASYHLPTKEHREGHPSYCSQMVIVDRRDARLLFSEMLMEQTSVPATFPFFVQNDMLYYIKARTVLSAIPI